MRERFQVGDIVSWNKSASDIAWELGLNANMVDEFNLDSLQGTILEVMYEYDDGGSYWVKWANGYTEFEFGCDDFDLVLVSRPIVGKDRYSKTLFDLGD